MPGFELFGDAERKEVKDVLDSGVLMRYGFDELRKGQWKAKDLEIAIEKRFSVQHAQLLSSGTAAVSMALAASGVGAGDEVIMPCFTFVASFEAILMLGAIPVVVDIDDTGVWTEFGMAVIPPHYLQTHLFDGFPYSYLRDGV